MRWYYLPKGSLFFSFDQGRDGFIVQEILHGNPKILGPSVSGIPGLSHGVLYYYVIAPIFYLGHGNPVIVSYFLSFLNALGIFIAYFLASLLTKKKVPGILAALIYACSFEATQYANLLTNASMAEWFMPLTYIGLYLWITKSWKWAPILTGIALGFTIQSELAAAYILAPVIFWLFSFRKKISKKGAFIFILFFLISISSMIVSEIKFHFPAVNGLIYLFTNQDGITKNIRLGDFLVQFLNQTGETFSYTIFPMNVVFGGLLGFIIIFYSLLKEFGDKNVIWANFLASYVFAYFFALPFGGWNMRHIMVGNTVAIAAFVGIFIWKYIGKNKTLAIFFIAIILLSNLYKIFKDNINGQTIFSLNSDMILSKEIQIIDYTYQKANGKQFSISTLTKPLYINTTWSYLYNWYGLEKYGYLPHWIGRDQIDQLGDNLEFSNRDILKHFFISESTFDIPDLYVVYAKGDQDAVSTLVEEKKFGDMIVQERVRKNEKN